MKLNNPCILTMPRSGSNLLENAVEAVSMFRPVKYHYCWNTRGKDIITIARDPFDTLVSFAAMRMHHRDGKIDKQIAKRYCANYRYLIENADMVIDYNDLVKDPSTVAKHITEAMGKRIFFNNPEIRQNTDVPEIRYLVSSVNSEHYRVAKEFFLTQDLSECYELYHKLLSLKTRFDL